MNSSVRTMHKSAQSEFQKTARERENKALLALSAHRLLTGPCKPLIELGTALTDLPADAKDGRQFKMKIKTYPDFGKVNIEISYSKLLTKAELDKLNDPGKRRKEPEPMGDYAPIEFSFEPPKEPNRRDIEAGKHTVEVMLGKQVTLGPSAFMQFWGQSESAFCRQQLAAWCGRMAPERVQEMAPLFLVAGTPSAVR